MGVQFVTGFDGLMLEALTEAWDQANWTWFRDGLRRPTFRLMDATTVSGLWQEATRTLSIERGFAWSAPWSEVLDTLHHEMAHQYVSEVLRVRDETAHGPSFRRVLAEMGLDARPAPAAGASEAVLERVRKLLALAASPHQHEAEAAMKAAHRLMTKHNLDLAAARTDAGLAVRHVGPAKARHAAWEKLLVGLLSEHFFVRVVWVRTVDRDAFQLRDGEVRLKRLTVAECTGTPANLDLAEWVHAFLTHTGERLWEAHRARRKLKGDRERQRYLSGVLVGFRQKLAESDAECREAGLVWVGDPQVDDLVGRRHPKLASRPAVRLVGSEAYHQGKEDGRAIVLHRPITSGGSGKGGLLEG